MDKQLPELLDKYKLVDLVIILAGTNDLFRADCDESKLFENIKSMHVECHRAGAKTVAITIPDSGRYSAKKDEWKEINERIRDYSRQNEKVILCDVARKLPYRTLDSELRGKYWNDKVHHTPFGYDTMAKVIFDDINGKF